MTVAHEAETRPTLARESGEVEPAADIWAGDVIEIVREATPVSPLVPANYIVGRGNRLLLKRECDNPTGSFKVRGAAVKIAGLGSQDREDIKVMAASAGNHAQGVARAAYRYGVPAEIHMPQDAPDIKVGGVLYHGGDLVTIVYHPDFETANAAVELAAATGDAINVRPFNDLEVMAGQGTVGLEILQQAEASDVTVDRIFVPAGGGGLLAGVAEAVKRTDPRVQVVGVQLEGNDSVYRSFHAGSLQSSSNVTPLCDGTAVGLAGKECMEKILAHVDDVIVISPADLGEAYVRELDRLSEIAQVYGEEVYGELREPAGMLAEAGAAVFSRMYPNAVNECWAAIASGGNFDLTRVDHFVEAYEAGRRDAVACYLGKSSVANSPLIGLRAHAI